MRPHALVDKSINWLSAPNGDGPLAGVRVLDFSELLPGPFLTQSLVELGADVIKLERPPHGDNARAMSPGLFKALHAGKRGGMLDLKDTGQRELALSLANTADVLVESYRPGVMDKLGLSYQELQSSNPGLVYASLSGYGATGPWRDLSGHDINYLAAAGVVSLCHSPETGYSLNQGVPVADLNGATYALAAINAALLQRVRTTKGQYLDVSLTDCMAHWMNTRRAVFQHSGITGLQEQRARIAGRPAYGVFECSDGKHLTLAALEQHFWKQLVKALKLGEQTTNRWQSHQERMQHADQINDRIAQVLLAMTRPEAMKRLREADVPAMEVIGPNEISEQSHFRERQLFNEDDDAFARFPIRMSNVQTTS